MKQVIIDEFGGIEKMRLEEVPTPEPDADQVRVRLTSIGMNHADLMARRGEYKIASGEPPFTPGIEAGGIIEKVGANVTDRQVDDRVVLSIDAPRVAAGGLGGTYRSHYIVPPDQTVVAPGPEVIPDDQLGTLWLAYLTAWGCLIWKQNLEPGQIVAIPAASSSVALAAAQIVKRHGGTAVGLTTSAQKSDAIKQTPKCSFDHLIVTHDESRNMLPFHRELKKITEGKGVDVFFDPVAAGAYLETEIRSLAQHGTIWVYGLLGKPDVLNVTALIRKHGSLRGWAVGELAAAGPTAFNPGCQHILEGFESGDYQQTIAGRFSLDDVHDAHREMEKGKHVGKLVLIP